MNESICVTVHGRKVIILKEELEDILEEVFEEDEFIKVLEKHVSELSIKKSLAKTNLEIAQKPAEGKAFLVKPYAIDKRQFEKKRKNSNQEHARILIVEAFEELEKNPKKYEKCFMTMIPKKTWPVKNCIDMELYAKKIRANIADWVHQALEWAQRIENGETWSEVCCTPDISAHKRVIVWKNGFYRIVGDTFHSKTINPCTYVEENNLHSLNILGDEVPLLVVKTN